MTPYEAYENAYNNHTKPGFDIKNYQEIACKDPEEAYYFAKDIPGANIEYCQNNACKNPDMATLFARNVPGANIEYCQQSACATHDNALIFAQNVPLANIDYCKEIALQKLEIEFSQLLRARGSELVPGLRMVFI